MAVISGCSFSRPAIPPRNSGFWAITSSEVLPIIPGHSHAVLEGGGVLQGRRGGRLVDGREEARADPGARSAQAPPSG